MQPSQSRPPELEAAATSWIDYMERVILFNETMHHGIRSALPIGKIADFVANHDGEPAQSAEANKGLARPSTARDRFGL